MDEFKRLREWINETKFRQEYPFPPEPGAEGGSES
jgi:hypothetical protein